MHKGYAVLGAAAVAGMLGASLYFATLGAPADRFADCRASQVSGGSGSIGGSFTLTDQTGKQVTDKEVFTRPSLLYFGYTFCPDVCPMDNARNAETVDLLERQGIEATPVFISVDPARDTPEVLAEFAAVMHPRMIALSGTAEQVKTASQAYKTYYKINDPEEEFYLVDHSTFTYLVLPETGFVEFFRREATPEEMAKTTACFVAASGGV